MDNNLDMTGIGRVTQLQSRNQGQINCVADQSFTHKPPHLPFHVHASCSCLYVSPGRVQSLSPFSFAKTLPSWPYTSWLLLSMFQHLFIEIWSPEGSMPVVTAGDFILCPKTFPAGQPGFPFTPLQAVSYSLAVSMLTQVMLEIVEICPEGNSRNRGWRTRDHCNLMCFLPLTATLHIYLQDFIQPPCRCKHMFASMHIRKPNP